MRLLKFVFCAEFLFAAFLLSSVFKSALPTFPIDLTIILFIFTGFIGLKRLIKSPFISKKILLPIIIFIIFILFSFISLIYSSSSIYAFEKVYLLFSLTTWAFIGPFVLINNKESLVKFLKSFLLITVLTCGYVLFDYYTSSSIGNSVRYGVDGSNALGLGRVASLGSIIILMMYMFNTNISKYKRIMAIIVLTILIIVLFITASRMALISLIFVTILLFIINTIKISGKVILINKMSIKVAFSLIPLPILLLPFQNFTQNMILRLENLSADSGRGSYSQRTEIYSAAFNIWKNNPFFGDGIGSFAINFTGIDDRYYPHNIILEILSELGLIGIVLLVILLVIPFLRTNFFKFDYVQICILLLFFSTFLNANTTGDINDNRMMFTFLALLYLYPMLKYQNKFD